MSHTFTVFMLSSLVTFKKLMENGTGKDTYLMLFLTTLTIWGILDILLINTKLPFLLEHKPCH